MMKSDLDSLKTEIEKYLEKSGLRIFRGYSRRLERMPEVEWDAIAYPDYRPFLAIAKELNVPVIVLHHREFSTDIIEDALDELPASGLDYDLRRQYEERLRALSAYEGFTCLIELSYEHNGILYYFEQRTEWFSELNRLLDEIHEDSEDGDEDEDDNPLGGYYSKN